MKRFILLLGLLVLGWQANAQNPLITGVVDACGSDGKFVELYVSGTVDFADYKLVRRSNNGTWMMNGVDIDISALGSRTDEFVYVCRDIATLGTEFPGAGISAANAIEDGGISHNGDDSYRLVEIAGDVVIDQFGGDTDGSGEPWEYVDTWAARNSGTSANGGFVIADWTFGTIDDLDAVGLCNDATNPPLESVAASVGSYAPPSTSSYCVPVAFPSDCAGGDQIDDFTIPNAGFSHLGTGCSANTYGDFSADPTLEIDLSQSVPYDFTMTHNFGSQFVIVWIDLNNDGTFDVSERVFESTGGANPTVGTITIPTTANLGATRLRAITRWNSLPLGPCTPAPASSAWGEVHDYTVNIMAPPACPQPVNTIVAGVTSDTADFTWDDVTEADGGFNWEVYVQGDDPSTSTAVATGTFPAGSTSGQVTGLSPQTDYDFYITSACGSDTSATTGPVPFTTACSIFVAPFSEDFGAVALPNCWEQGAANSENWLFADNPSGHIGNVGSFPNTSASGGGFAWVDDSSPHNTDTRLETPFIDISGLTTPALSFFYISDNEGDANGNVDFSIEVWDGAAWNQVFFSDQNSPNEEWTQVILDISTLTFTGDIKAAFIVNENNGTGFDDDVAIDDISVDELPTCFPPSNLMTTNITTSGVDLSWDADASETTGYEWVVMNAGDMPDVGTAVVTGTVGTGVLTASVAGLTSSSSYAAYVRTNCNPDGLSDWSVPANFDTLCDVFPAPFTEDFSTLALPNCWENGANNAKDWEFTDDPSGDNVGDDGSFTTSSASGGGYAWLDESSPHSQDSRLETPFIDISGLTIPSLSFYYISNNQGDDNVDFRVEVWDGAAWNQVFFSNQNSPGGEWAQIILDISTLTLTGDIKVAFIIDENNGTDFNDDVAIDDVVVDEVPPCIAPTNITVTDVFNTSADISWDAITTATLGYNWEVYLQGDDPATDPLISSGTFPPGSTSGQLTGLAELTAYDVYLISNCDADGLSIAGGPVSFTTVANCPEPGSLSFDVVTNVSATFTWVESFNASAGYLYEIYAQGDDPAADTPLFTGNFPSGTSSGQVTGLTSDTAYDFYLTSDCDSDGTSTQAGPLSFSTLCDPIVAPYTEDFEAGTTTPTCWVQGPNNVDGWEFGTGEFYTNIPPGTESPSGGNNAHIDDSNPDAEETIFTPLVDVSGLTNPAFSFYWTSGDLGIYEPVDFRVDVWDGAAWNNVFERTSASGITTNGFEAVVVDLSTLNITGPVQARFISDEVEPGDFQDDLAIDDVSFDELPAPALVQVVHNSADPAAQFVDVYVDGVLTLDDFEFRTATPFVNLPSVAPVSIDVAPSNSADVSESIYNLTAPLASGETYVVVANGVLDPMQFDESVNTPIAFNLDIFAGAQQTSTNAGETSLLINHGSTDAPTVDVVETSVPAGTLADDLSYPQFAGYVDVPTADYLLNVELADNSAVVASYEANLATLGTSDLALTVLASGFLDPTANQNGAGFGLWAALPTGGDLVELPLFIPPPVNDNACDAIPLTVGAPSPGDQYTNVSATAEPNEPVPGCFNGGINGSVWFTFVAPASGDVTVTTDIVGGTLTDTEVAVYDAPGDCADLTTFGADLGCNQDVDFTNFLSTVVLSSLTPGNTYYIQVDQWGSATPGTFGIRVLDNNPPCPEPTNLSASGITASSAVLNWDDVANATLGFTWEVFASGDVPGVDVPVDSGTVGAGVTTATATGLMAETDYDFYVTSDCDADGLSIFGGPGSFTTACAPFIPDYAESFDTYLPNCWTEAGSGDPTTGPSDIGDSLWVHDQFLNGTGADNSVNINLFTTNREDWLISPSFDLSGGTYELKYVAAVTDFANSNPPEQNGMGSDDEVQVLISTDGGLTWINLVTYNQSSFPSATGDVEIFDLSAYTGVVQFAFWATDGTVNDPEDYDFFIDEFEVRTPPACPQPIGITVTATTPTSVDFSWTDDPAATLGYIWEIYESGDVPGTDPAVDSGTTAAGMAMAQSTALSPETAYDIYVTADCNANGTSTVSGPVSFTTPIAPVIVNPGAVESDTYCYDNNDFKEWLFESSDGSPLQITFTQGSVEEFASGTFDDLVIYDGQDDTGTVLFDSDLDPGQADDLTGLTLVAQSGFMYITLTTDGSVSCADGDEVSIAFDVSIFVDPASVQIIHNSADPVAQFVDVYVDGVLTLTDFEFRTATPFVDLPAGQPVSIDVAPAGSTGVSDSVYNLTTTLTSGETYIAVANGVLDPTQFDDSVNAPIAFNLDIFVGAQQASTNTGETSLLINHGATDAPAVDAVEISVPAGTLADDLAYTQFAGYLDVPTLDFLINVETADNSGLVATYSAPLATLGTADLALTVVASGFLDPAANQNGAAFGLWAALPTGGALVELPVVEPATAAPDPAFASTDVISLFSGVYTDVTVDTFLTPWSNAQLNDVQVQGNDTKRYHRLDFAGIETVANPVDASTMDFLHLDVWSPNATTFRVKLVNDLGGPNQVEGELAFSIAAEQWVSLEIPLNDFADPSLVTDANNLLTGRDALAQYIISGLPAGAVVAYVDNIYFRDDPNISTVVFDKTNFSFYPSPAKNNLYLQSSLEVEEVTVFNMLGQEVIRETPNTLTPTISVQALQTGTYIMNVTIDGETKAFRFLKE